MKVLVLRLVPQRGLFLHTKSSLPLPEFPKKVFLPKAAMELRYNLLI